MSGYAHARLDLDAERFRQSFDREPMGFSHNLSGLDLFKIDSLHALAEKMVDHPRDYFIVESRHLQAHLFFRCLWLGSSLPKLLKISKIEHVASCSSERRITTQGSEI